MRMDHQQRRQRIEVEGLIIGYAMSRLDDRYLSATGTKSWRAAFEKASNALSIPKASFKNLRDEFDPMHDNPRKGWRQRPIRLNRQRVADEFSEVSDEALIEFVLRILARDEVATEDAVNVLLPKTGVAANVAERLLTGRRAEEFFLANSSELVGLNASKLVDCRLAAKGYDFDSPKDDNRVFEVKGIKKKKGDIQFTDREWLEAKDRKDAYWLIVIGNLQDAPIARVIQDPYRTLAARCFLRRSIAASWRSSISIR